MKILNIILLAGLIISCQSGQKKEISNHPAGDYLLIKNSLVNLVALNHQKIKGEKGDFEAYKQYLSHLSKDSLSSIPYALDYIKTCLLPDTIRRDSVFFLFNNKFNEIVNVLNDSLDTRYQPLETLMDKDSVTEELTAFKQNLQTCGIGIFTSEGFYYLDVIHDFFYNNFKGRVSEGLRAYLEIQKDELKEGFSEDAGMLISFTDLYKRIKRWEHFVKRYPQNIFKEEADSKYTTYLQTLFTGMDNTPAFDFENNTLLPEIRTIFEHAMQDDPESPTTGYIKDYFQFLSRHDFKNNDSIPKYLEMHKMTSMMAVQPDTR